jgi:hypothetical protein
MSFNISKLKDWQQMMLVRLQQVHVHVRLECAPYQSAHNILKIIIEILSYELEYNSLFYEIEIIILLNFHKINYAIQYIVYI